MNKEELIKGAFKEDIPTEDLTTSALNISERFGIAQLIAKQDLILSGSELFEESIHFINPHLNIQWNFSDGSEVLNQQIIAQIDGNLVDLLKAERVALNFLGYLSGIATMTSRFVKACHGTNCKILDTRKTLPLYRTLAKKAVLDGGGSNHRMNLSDGILIKENHLALSENIKTAVSMAHQKYQNVPVEVETKNLDEVKAAVEAGAQRIMLDNMSLDLTKKALEIIPNNIETEASGNMTLDRIPHVAQTGVNFISVGALTHSAPCADVSLLFEWN